MTEDPLNECREQFFHSDGMPSDRSLQSFSSKLEKFLKVNIFFRKQTFLEKFVDQVESTFDNFSKLFAPMLQNVLPTVGKQWRNSNVPRKNSSTKELIRTHKVQLWRTCQKFLPNIKYLLPQIPLEDKSFFPRKKRALLKTFLLLNIFRQKSGKFLISTRKNCKSFFFKNQIFHKVFFVHMNCILTLFLKPLRQSARIFSSQPEDGEKTH